MEARERNTLTDRDSERESAFDLAAVPPGTRTTFAIDVTHLPMGDMLELPLLVARGAAPGPTVAVLAGVHGDEYEGMAAVRDVFRSLNPAEMHGTFLGVPLCNPPAFAAVSRVSPIDQGNLARVFPGRVDGTVSERVAHVLTTQVIASADFLVDLHSSGQSIAMPLLVGYDGRDTEASKLSYAAAQRFGVPIIWGHARVSPGRTISEAQRRGISWLYTECPSGGWLHRDIAAVYARGVINVMRYLRVLPGEASAVAIERDLAGDGDVDRSLAAPVSGFLVGAVELLQRVAEGDLLGTIENPYGDVLAEMRAPVDGTVVLCRRNPVVATGDIAFLLT